MKPVGTKQKKPLKQDKAKSMSITLPRSQVARLDAIRAIAGLSRGKYVITLMDHQEASLGAVVQQ